jgi:hypothetical protein
MLGSVFGAASNFSLRRHLWSSFGFGGVKSSRAFAAGGAFVAVVAVAGTVWPFSMASVPGFQHVTYSFDGDVGFMSASRIPMFVMNVASHAIKRGDTIRVIYVDGKIVDFPVLARCGTSGCALGEPTVKSSATDVADPNPILIAEASTGGGGGGGGGGGCSSGSDGSRTVEVPTGYWASRSAEVGGIVFVTGGWVNTGSIGVAVSGGEASRGGCR